MSIPVSPLVDRGSRRWLQDPDVQLMLRVREGDGASFAELVHRYGRRVLGFFHHQVPDCGEAEDLTQEVFLRLHRYRLRYRPRARFATWIFFIARNVARNAHRTRSRRPCVSLQNCSLAQRNRLLDPSGPPSGAVERQERAAAVRAAVAELDGRKRQAVEMHQLGEKTYAEVGTNLRMTAKAAKSLLYRARLELRDLLAPVIAD
jgi:RNA polymerase sigma-70 factor (ECF subfamily)